MYDEPHLDLTVFFVCKCGKVFWVTLKYSISLPTLQDYCKDKMEN